MSQPVTEPTIAPQAPEPHRASDRTLRRVLTALIAVTVVVGLVFATVYFLGQRSDAPPPIPDQNVVTAEDAVKAAPNDISLRLQLASAYAQAGRTEDALAQFDEVLRANPGNRAALLGAGTMQYQQGQYAAAKDRYTQFVKTAGGGEFAVADPQLEQAYYFLGASNLGLDDAQGAKAALDSALGIDRTDADAWYLLGEAQSRLGQYQQATEAYKQAITFVPTGWCDPYTGLQNAFSKLSDADGSAYAQGMASLCEGNYTAGATALSKITTGPFAVSALLGLAVAAEDQGETDAAIANYRKVVALDSSNVAALTALARLGEKPTTATPTATPEAGS